MRVWTSSTGLARTLRSIPFVPVELVQLRGLRHVVVRFLLSRSALFAATRWIELDQGLESRCRLIMATMSLSRRKMFSFILSTATLSVGCSGVASRPSACDGLVEKTIGITRDDYSACAGEILAALDSLEAPLGRFVRTGDEAAESEADAHSRRLRHLMSEVGFTADVWREAREGADRTVQRWPDGAMHQFNNEVGGAVAQYVAALRYPNEDNFTEGRRRHAAASQVYARFR